jgi:sugar phosphate isomerase/epimerase
VPTSYRFSLGPWNIGRGGDPFGPPVRPAVSFDEVLDAAVALGFEGIQFHDDDAVPDLEQLSPACEGTAVRESKDPIRTSGQLLEAIDAILVTSKAVFERLVEKARSFPEKTAAECIAIRDYEALERLVLEHLLGC